MALPRKRVWIAGFLLFAVVMRRERLTPFKTLSFAVAVAGMSSECVT